MREVPEEGKSRGKVRDIEEWSESPPRKMPQVWHESIQDGWQEEVNLDCLVCARIRH